MKLRLLLGLGVLLALGVGVSAARALLPAAGSCSGGVIAPNTYSGLIVTGNCTITGAVTVNGDVTVADGAYLDAAYKDTRLTVNGNVKVGRGAKLGLGCTYGYHDCGLSPVWLGNITVNGSIIANQALTMYLDFVTVHGSVWSFGGGPGSSGPFLNLPIKDNTIDGTLVVLGWRGGWFGIIRNTVGGSVLAAGNASVVTETGPGTDSDSTEIQTNTISGNLICGGNNPHAQVNPNDGGQPNNVSGHKSGECSGL
jgi:hypothetical protein